MRKPIQIQAVQVETPLGEHRGIVRDVQLFALCDDGSLWTCLSRHHDAQWQRLPDIPGQDSGAAGDKPVQGSDIASDKPAQAGKRWEQDDDHQLVQMWQVERLSCAQIAERVQRSKGAIASRLVHLDLFDDRDAVRDADRERRAATLPE